jgi:hypothetical protein
MIFRLPCKFERHAERVLHRHARYVISLLLAVNGDVRCGGLRDGARAGGAGACIGGDPEVVQMVARADRCPKSSLVARFFAVPRIAHSCARKWR